jgi:hypothetical protein
MASTYTDLFKCGFLPGKKRIVYNVARTSDGWRLSAYVPPSAPTADRMTVVQWFGDYKNQVKQAQPDWIVQFKVEDLCHYEMNVTPTRMLGANGSKVAHVDELENAWRQLSLDYA